MPLKKYHIIDCHCDTISKLTQEESIQNERCDVSIQKMQHYGSYTQLFAAWIQDSEVSPLKEVLRLIDKFNEEISGYKDIIVQVLTAADFERAISEGKAGAMLSVENGNCLEGELFNLRNLYLLGVRAMTLTWNGYNEISDGIGESRGAGLTDFGRMVVAEMNRLGMIVDVSHISEKGFWDVLSLSRKPVMASHSNCRALASHKRNLTDEQIKALAEKGGVIGLNLYPLFLSDDERATLDDCLCHVRHLMNVGGEDCLVLGSDFDGFSAPFVENLTNAGDYGNLFALMEKRGYSDRLIDKLTHKNFICFAKAVFGEK